MIVGGLALSAALAATPVVVWDFSESDHGFVSGGESGQWEHGVPSSGPGGADAVWATHLAGAYLNDTVDTLELPPLDLGGLSQPTLVLTHWHRIRSGDAGWVEARTGPTWTRLEPVLGYPTAQGFSGVSDFVDTSFDLSGLPEDARVRLVFEADPLFADAGWYVAAVSLWDGDVTPPGLSSLVEPVDTQELDQGYEVRVLVTDDTGIDEVTLIWAAGGTQADQAMAPLGAGIYRAHIPPQPPDTVVTWQIVATDVEDNEATWPSVPASFRVFLAAPQDVEVQVAAREVSDRAVVRWSPPDTPHPVRGYVVQDIDAALAPVQTADTAVEVVVGPDDPQRYRVAAVYEAGRGDWSPEVELGLEVPELRVVEPASAFQGETLHLRIVGSSLYLREGQTTLELGPGLEITSLDVLDVNRVDAWVRVDGAAPAGERDLALTGARGTFVFEGAFEVRDRAAGPRVVSVSPEQVLQGARAEVEITANQPFAGPLTVTHGEGVLLLNDAEVDGERARFLIAVAPDAALGEHTLILDDGSRRLAAAFEVKERVYHLTTRGCATAPGASGLWLLALGAAARRRRRSGQGGGAIARLG